MAIKKQWVLVVAIALISISAIAIVSYSGTIATSIADHVFAKAATNFSPDVYDLDRADQWLNVVAVIDSEYPGLHYQRARLHFVRGDLPRALEAINAEIALRPDYARAFYIKGLIELYSGEHANAAQSFIVFNEARPDNWAGFNDLAYVYLQMGEYDRAEQVALNGLANNPDNVWLRMNLGVALLNLDRDQEARDIFIAVSGQAEQLTEADAISAYPGNDPRLAMSVIAEIKEGARLNRMLAERTENDATSYVPGYHFVTALPNGRGFVVAACDESIGLDMSPSLILRGQSGTLSWSLLNVENCSIDNGVGVVSTSPPSRSVSPANSTTYTLTCNSISPNHLHDMTFIDTAQLRVRWADMTASANGGAHGDGPYTLYMPNTSTRLAWQSEEASSCSATGDLSGPITVDGSRDLGHLTRGSGTPGLGRLYRFGVNCEGASDSVDVRVMQLPTCTISPNKTTVTPPETVRLNWSCRYADSGTIADNHGGTPVALSINNNADYQSSGIVQVRISDNQTYIYTLRAIGIDGTTSVASAVINGPSDGVRIREDLP